MKRLVLVALLVSCGGKKEDARCAQFADRVATCTYDPDHGAARTPEERDSVREHAYAACAKTTDDKATLHYYGDVDKKVTCMQNKDCPGVLDCLTADDPYRPH